MGEASDARPDEPGSASAAASQTASSAREAGLAVKVARGAGWIVASRLMMRVFGFLNTIVVARLLAPEDFGLIAVGMTAVQLLQGLSDIGVSQAVVKFQDAGRREIDTLFTLSALRGAAIAAVMLATAALAGHFYGDPRIAWVFCGLAAYPLLLGLVNPRFFEFERNIDFSKEFVWEVAAKLVSVVVTIAVAFMFRTYWAIVLGVVAGAATQVALSYLMRPYAPRLSLAAWRRVWGFSGWLTGVSFIVALSNKLDAFVLARTAGPADTGAYWMGFQLAELPTSELAWPIARAVYPGLSAMQGDKERMRVAYLRGVQALAAVALPAAVGFAFVATDLIHVLLGEKWERSALVVAWLTPAIGLQTVFIATQYYAMALGLTRLVFIRGLIVLLIKAPVFIWAAVTHGFVGAVAAATACTIFGAAMNLILYSRASGRPPFDPIVAARRSFGAVAAMAAYFLAIRPLIGVDRMGEAGLRLVFDIAAGGAVYLAAHILFWRLEGRPQGAERTALDLASRLLAKATPAR
jgi:PST family polysaccharide transporter